MGVLTSLIQFSGSLGNELTAYMLNGKPVVRKKAIHQHQPNTPAQLAQRQRWGLISSTFNGMGNYFKMSFAEMAAEKKNVYACVIQYNIRNAIVGDYPNQTIDFSCVKVGRGSLTPIDSATCKRVGNELIFSWKDNSRKGSARKSDVAMPAVYNKETNRWRSSTNRGTRGDGTCKILVPESWTSDKLELWITFRRANGSLSSDSVYVKFKEDSPKSTIKKSENNKAISVDKCSKPAVNEQFQSDEICDNNINIASNQQMLNVDFESSVSPPE